MTVEAPMWKSQSTITIPWKGNAEATVTELLSTTLDVARSVLIDVAKSGKKITYGELAKRSGTGYPAQSMGKVLDVLSLDCSDRGEPSLAPIVVRAATMKSRTDMSGLQKTIVPLYTSGGSRIDLAGRQP